MEQDMRKTWMGLLAAAVMMTGVNLSAQSSKPVSFGIAGGAAIPFGDFSNVYSTGYNGTVALGLSPVGFPVGLRFEGSYNKFLGRSDVGTHADIRIIAGTANLVYSLPGVGIRPYLIGGVGYYSRKADLANAQTINTFGANAGAGVMFPLSDFNAYVEARGHIVFSDGPRFVPVTFGVLF
jgi:hypothetical protein